jgi:hypothetical protein
LTGIVDDKIIELYKDIGILKKKFGLKVPMLPPFIDPNSESLVQSIAISDSEEEFGSVKRQKTELDDGNYFPGFENRGTRSSQSKSSKQPGEKHSDAKERLWVSRLLVIVLY